MAVRPLDYRNERFKRTDDSSVAMAIDASGGDKTFRVAAPAGERWLGVSIGLVITDNTAWNSDGFANINAGITNGVLIRKQRLSSAETIWQWNILQNKALLEKFDFPTHPFAWDDGEHTLKLRLDAGANTAFHVTADEVLEILIRDDLSLISSMRGHLNYGVLA